MLILIILWGAAYLLRGIGRGLLGGNLQRSVTPSHSAETQPQKPTNRPGKMTCGAFYASHRLWSTFRCTSICVSHICLYLRFKFLKKCSFGRDTDGKWSWAIKIDWAQFLHQIMLYQASSYTSISALSSRFRKCINLYMKYRFSLGYCGNLFSVAMITQILCVTRKPAVANYFANNNKSEPLQQRHTYFDSHETLIA